MNCLKCGRTVADGELLCPACSGQESHPEPEVKIHIHVHHRETPDSAECPVALPQKKKPRRRRPRRPDPRSIIRTPSSPHVCGMTGFPFLRSCRTVSGETDINTKGSILWA